MDQREWKKINDIVDKALDLEREKRPSFIEEKCAGNESLQYKVKELLKSIERSDTVNFLEGTESFPARLAADLSKKVESHDSSLIGETVGQYKIIELIGHGGMGSVFLTERADDAYDQQVALKILRRGMDTPSNVERFKRERTILASLNHPNIARLLDGGVTKNGLPYLVMEYVDGTPLLEYCDERQLSVGERLELFKSVCEAVQHAHRNATIHRDLKPSNIYVTDKGDVKILDFGIAKLLEPESPDKTLFQTQTGARMLTLGYAAPEQIENGAITTATDSYTLGLLLYELLAGAHPFNMDDKDLTSIEKLICIQTPAKPSKKFKELSETEKTKIASRRHSTPSDLLQDLKGDLDAIVMKALRKEPEARYLSVEQMLEDLNRYNQSLPLVAQSDTIRYRFGKFVKRNHRTLIGILLTLAVVIGFGSYHVEQIREERNTAEREAQKAQTVKNFLVDIFRSSNPRSTDFEGKNLSAEQLLINGENAISKNLQNQPDVYTEVSLAIGDALKSIDALKKAEKSYKKALEKSSQTTKPLENKLRAYLKLGWLYTDSRKSHETAYQYALDAQELLKKVEKPSPALEASIFGLIGRVHSVRGNREQGHAYFAKADSIYVSAGLENSYKYIKMLTGYGRALLYVFDFKKAEEVLLKSNRLHRQKYGDSTLTIAENYKFIAWTNRELGNFDKSNKYFLKSIDLKKELIDDSTVQTAIPMYHLARNYTLSGDFEKSEQLALKVLDIYRENLEPGSQYILLAKNYVAIAKLNQHKYDEAEKLLHSIIEESESPMHLAGVKTFLAQVYKETGRFQEAVSLLEESIKFNKKKLGPRSRAVGVDMLKLANTYRAEGEYEMAQKYFRQVKSIFEEEIPDDHYREAEYYFKLAKLKQKMDKPREARKYFKQAYHIYLDLFGEDSYRAKKAKSYL